MSLILKGLQISRFFWLIKFLMFLAINKSLCLTHFQIFLLIIPQKKAQKSQKNQQNPSEPACFFYSSKLIYS